MRFLLPHPHFWRYYLGERVTPQYLYEQLVPNDPPSDMLFGGRLVIREDHYGGTDYDSLVTPELDYASFRERRLMPPIGDRHMQRRPGTARPSSSQQTVTGRGGGRSSSSVPHSDSSGAANSRMPPPR